MNIFKKMAEGTKKVAANAGAKIKKHSPEILVGLGIIGFGATVYTACKATVKVKKIMADHNDQMRDISVAAITTPTCEDGTVYSVEDAENDTKITNIQTCAKVAKTVVPSVTLGIFSVASILCGFKILKGRNLALIGAYKALETSYNLLTENVKKELGEERAEELISGLRKTGTDINGGDLFEPTTEEVAVKSVKPYAIYFSPATSHYWDTYSDWSNEFLITSTMNTMNEKLKCNGFVFLSDIYKELGIDVTPISTRVGWTYGGRADKARKNGLKPDEYIDFRIKKVYLNDLRDEEMDDLLKADDHLSPSNNIIYYLDFNVDGEMWEYV